MDDGPAWDEWRLPLLLLVVVVVLVVGLMVTTPVTPWYYW